MRGMKRGDPKAAPCEENDGGCGDLTRLRYLPVTRNSGCTIATLFAALLNAVVAVGGEHAAEMMSPQHASIPTTHGGSFSARAISVSRLTLRRIICACLPSAYLATVCADAPARAPRNALKALIILERAKGFKPSTPTLARLCFRHAKSDDPDSAFVGAGAADHDDIGASSRNSHRWSLPLHRTSMLVWRGRIAPKKL
jgi:hypothetical protein